MFSSRFLESHWFVWVTQMNHIVMEIDREPYRDWFSSQVRVARAVTRVPRSLGVDFPGLQLLAAW